EGDVVVPRTGEIEGRVVEAACARVPDHLRIRYEVAAPRIDEISERRRGDRGIIVPVIDRELRVHQLDVAGWTHGVRGIWRRAPRVSNAGPASRRRKKPLRRLLRS